MSCDDPEYQEAPVFDYPDTPELIEIFFDSNKEAQEMFDQKIFEWQQVVMDTERDLKPDRQEVANLPDARSRAFWTEAINILPLGQQIQEAQVQMSRLWKLKRVAAKVFGVPEELYGLGPKGGKRIAAARQVSILDVIGAVVRLRSVGKNYQGLCPLHKDTHPSLVVYPEDNQFRCFGCGKQGDVIEFVMQYYECGFTAAIRRLLGESGATK